MNYCLINATRYGTGTEADLFWSQGIATAGKTGTTTDNKDKWYCGFTGYYTAAVWTGYDQPEAIRLKSGSNPAAQLFKKVMSPIHKGLKNINLYNSRLMKEVTVCLDSGKLATDACKNDVRVTLFANDGFGRTTKACVYEEDMIKDKCDKHSLVNYCSGGGVAHEYCQKFAAVDPTVKIQEKALVKITQEQLDEIRKAKDYGLTKYYVCDEWIWLVDENGKDLVFNGINGKLKQTEKAPYLLCPTHTKEAWEEYQSSILPEPEIPTDPSGDAGIDPVDLNVG